MNSKKIFAVSMVVLLLCSSLILFVGMNDKTDGSNVTVDNYYGRYVCKWHDEYLESPASEYNAHLATASFCLVQSCCMGVGQACEESCDNFERFADDIGFENVACNEYMKVTPTTDSIGAAAATKKIGDYTVIMLGLRWGDYALEWVNNMKVGTGEGDGMGYHEGFKQSADKVVSFLNKYISEHGISGKIKLWAAGYSRLGSVSNILGGMIDTAIVENRTILNNVTITKNDLFVYTFESPNTVAPTTNVDVHGESYSNIWNFRVPYDLVTALPGTSWGFTCFGNIKPLQQLGFGTTEFGDNWDMFLFFYKVRGYNKVSLFSNCYKLNADNDVVIDKDPLSPYLSEYILKFVEMVSEKIGDRTDYVNNGHQAKLMEFTSIMSANGNNGFMSFVGAVISKAISDSEGGQAIIDALLEEGKKPKDLETALKAWMPSLLASAGLDATKAERASYILSEIAYLIKNTVTEKDPEFKTVVTFFKNYSLMYQAHAEYDYTYCWLLAEDDYYYPPFF